MYTKFLKFLPTANAAKSYSKDPSTQVGAIAIDDDYNIRAQGYNGFPRGVLDTEERLNDRTKKYPRMVHAEANLVAMAARTGVSLQGCSVLLTSLHPCSTCAGLLIQSGVKRIFTPEQVENARWDESGEIALEMFQEAGVEVVSYTSEKKPVTLDDISGDGILKQLNGEGVESFARLPKVDMDSQFHFDSYGRRYHDCRIGVRYYRRLSSKDKEGLVVWGEWYELTVFKDSNTQEQRIKEFKSKEYISGSLLGMKDLVLIEAIEEAGGPIPYWTGSGLTGPLLIEKIHKELDKRLFSDVKQSEFLQKCEWGGKDYIRYGSRVERSRTIQWGEWLNSPQLLDVMGRYPLKLDLGWENYIE